jgi:subtilisin family serine protease
MGTMVGADGGKNNIGVAPEAKWMGCRNMNKGVGTVSTYLECFEFFLAPYPQGGDPQKDGRPDLAPHVINNSWGCPESEGCKGPEFLQAVRAMHAAGIMVIAAAGNDGSGCSSVVDPPGNYSGELISVGAYNRYTSDIAFYSSRGPSNWNGGLAPVLVAPGTLIRSAINEGPNSYDEKAGTSMASPHVAGIVALLWSARPELIGQIQKTAEILTTTAKPMQSSQSCGSFPGHQIPNAVFGYGMVDAYKAITSQ